MATLTVNPKVYGELLAGERPTAIRNDAEHAAAVEHLTQLAIKDNTPEELEFLNLLAALVEHYEQRRWARKRDELSGVEMLQFLMEENGLKQADLADITSQANISAILAGKRQIGPATAAKLGKRFRINPHLFLDL
ncbi:MAG TPA: helix-turn-helix domain-containing protein [Bryobacteraceae bacterium]